MKHAIFVCSVLNLLGLMILRVHDQFDPYQNGKASIIRYQSQLNSLNCLFIAKLNDRICLQNVSFKIKSY